MMIWIRTPVAATVQQGPRCVSPDRRSERTESVLTQRAVAIRALGWRLRVQPRLTYRFENTMKLANLIDLVGQSPLPERSRRGVAKDNKNQNL
jgi:hypothetical protein